MNTINKRKRYQRIFKQLEELLDGSHDPIANKATAVALLHNKFEQYFWTGFYDIRNGELKVGPYQGSLACMKLANNTGVCWSAINQKRPVIVNDVEEFPGHIGCDPRSRSEIVIPLKNKEGEIESVLDVDAKAKSAFDEVDAEELTKIVSLIYR